MKLKSSIKGTIFKYHICLFELVSSRVNSMHFFFPEAYKVSKLNKKTMVFSPNVNVDEVVARV